MYNVYLIKDGVEELLFSSNSIKSNSKIVKGVIAEERNAIASFSFTLYPSNPFYEDLKEYASRISVFNTQTNKYVFEGRVLICNPSMDESGLYYKDIVCESALGYLNDSVQMYRAEKVYGSAKQFLDEILTNHNNQVPEYKKIYSGDITHITGSFSKAIVYENTWELVKWIISEFGGEIALKKVDGVHKLDYKESVGSLKSTTIEVGKNIKTSKKQVDPSAVITRVIPLGAKISVDGTETSEKLTISSVNGGMAYVQDDEAYSEYGEIYKTVEFEKISNPTDLKAAAIEWLQKNNYAKINVSITALDLSLIGLEVDEFNVLDSYRVINKYVGIDNVLTIVKRSVNILEPHTSTFELGTFSKKFSDLYKKQNQAAASSGLKVEELAMAVKNNLVYISANFATITNLEAVNASITNLSAIYAKITDLDATNASIANLSAIYAKITDLNAVNASITNLSTIYAKITDLNATNATITSLDNKYAKIDLANIAAGSIKNAMISTGAIGTAQIADGSITDAKIVALTATKITSGTLDAGVINVINLNCANLTVGTINGTQIANGAIDSTKLATAINTAISNAQATANGKNTVYYSTTAPSGGTYKVNDTWFDTDDGNKIYYWNGTAWTATLFGTNAISNGAIDSTKLATAINTAISNAQTTANGKNTVYYSATAPTGGTYKVNDTWFDTDDGNKIYYWNGTAWTATAFGTNAISNACITNALIADATIQNAKIANIDAAKITTGYISADRIAANSLTLGKLDSTLQLNLNATIWLAKANFGKLLYQDVTFANGFNEVFKYANRGADFINLVRSASDSNCPTTSGYTIKFTHTGYAAPELGGFYQQIYSRPNAVFLIKYLAKLPVGYTLKLASNPMGNSYEDKWLTSNAGTGKWAEYVRLVQCGEIGTFSFGGHVFVSGPTPSVESPLLWELGAIYTYDVTDTSTTSAMSGWCYNNNTTFIDGGKIYTGTITAEKIAANTITAESGIIATGAITNALIADATIQNAKIANIDAAKITTGYLSADRIAANAITTTNIAANAITTALIAAGAITATQIAVDAVTADKIVSSAITTAKIAAGAVTANEIAANAITAAKIAAGVILATHLGAGSVTSAAIAAGAVTAEKITVGSGGVAPGNLASGKATSGTTVSTSATDGAKTVGSAYVEFSAGNMSNNAAESAYLQIDLGGIYRLAESRLYFYSADARTYFYKIKYSSDGTNWYYAVGNETLTGWAISVTPRAVAIGSSNPTIDSFGVPISARYIRVYANGNSVNIGNHIYEWEVFSTAQTIIDGSSIATGEIKSINYVANTTGMKINLLDGSWDSKYFKINSLGEVTATSGYIGEWQIKDGALYSTSGYTDWTGVSVTHKSIIRPNCVNLRTDRTLNGTTETYDFTLKNVQDTNRGQYGILGTYLESTGDMIFMGRDLWQEAERNMNIDAGTNINISCTGVVDISCSELIVSRGNISASGSISASGNIVAENGNITTPGLLNLWSNASGIVTRNNANSFPVPITASAFVVSSSKRYKEHVEYLSEDDANKLLSLKTAKFDYINGEKNQYGLYAEDTAVIIPSCVHFGENGETEGIDYAKLVPFMIKKIQMQENEIRYMKTMISHLQGMAMSKGV